MANELTVKIDAELVNGKLREKFSPNGGTTRINQSAAKVTGGTVALTTSESVISTSAITTLGWLFVQNMDATNSIEYGPESGGALVGFGLLKPGEAAALRLKTGVVIRAKAAAGTPTLFYKVTND